MYRPLYEAGILTKLSWLVPMHPTACTHDEPPLAEARRWAATRITEMLLLPPAAWLCRGELRTGSVAGVNDRGEHTEADSHVEVPLDNDLGSEGPQDHDSLDGGDGVPLALG